MKHKSYSRAVAVWDMIDGEKEEEKEENIFL